MASKAQKDTIYIDAEDDITAIVDKVRGSKEKIVALVLPKHAPVLQSSVNMKLLKRASDLVKKNIVLISSESAVLSLAGVSGIYVAKTLQSKPVVPKAVDKTPAVENITPDTAPLVDESELDLKKPIGEYMKYKAVSEEVAPTEEKKPVETLKPVSALPVATAVQAVQAAEAKADDEDVDPEVLEMIEAPSAEEEKEAVEKIESKDEKKFKIPNFDAFRLKFFIAIVVVVLLVVGGYFAFTVMPKASVTITTENSTQNLTDDIIANTSATEASGTTLPAKSKESKQSVQEVISSPSGTKDLGTKATGTVTIVNCSSSVGSITIPVGTGVSSGDLTYLTNKTIVLPASTFNGALECTTPGIDVNVTSIAAGDKYNADAKSYAIADVPSKVTGQGTAMTGGTTKVAKVVTEQDVENAKQKLLEKLNKNIKKDLADQLTTDGYYALTETYNETQTTVKSVPAVGEEATTATVSMDVAYTMYGVKNDALKKYVGDKLATAIDPEKQQISDDGLSKATIKVNDSKDPKNLKLTLQTTATVGPKLDAESVKSKIVGKKSGDVRDALRTLPGVKDVTVTYSPFWVSSAPKNLSKITVTIKTSGN